MNNDTPADAITQGIDVFAERQAFETWWKQWVPDGTMPSPTSHIFDAWLASARHRTPSLAAQDGLVEALRYMLRVFDETNTDKIDDVHLMVKQGAKITSIADCRAALASIEVKPDPEPERSALDDMDEDDLNDWLERGRD